MLIDSGIRFKFQNVRNDSVTRYLLCFIYCIQPYFILQFLNPVYNILKYDGCNCLFYLSVFVDLSRGALLEKMIQTGVFLDLVPAMLMMKSGLFSAASMNAMVPPRCDRAPRTFRSGHCDERSKLPLPHRSYSHRLWQRKSCRLIYPCRGHHSAIKLCRSLLKSRLLQGTVCG